jgi:hypothetical protein
MILLLIIKPETLWVQFMLCRHKFSIQTQLNLISRKEQMRVGMMDGIKGSREVLERKVLKTLLE